ncbi:alpha/beta hydrolase-fold protein [Psychroserpens sp. XS_ASV72]|uniref:alpha/beta hydrolase-fold protein n=1 Tax=Psychroserpens sp. XS_ASV72 TaxID=3241293 RepID=UPI0035125C75
MKFLKILNLTCLILFCNLTFAQSDANKTHTINSKAFNKERYIKVFLPERYQNDTITKFATVYVLDAQHDIFWNIAKGNIGYMVDNYSIIPMIVVGIDSDNRGSEFNPENTELHEHFKNEVMPFIESNYRVDGFNILVGHSWAGAFVGNTIFSDQRDLFDAYIGISPSFGGTDNVIEKNAKKMLEDQTHFGKYLYFSYGTVGRREMEFGGFVKSIDTMVQQHPNKTLAWQPQLIEGVGHWQIVGPTFSDGLISMSRNYFADQKVIEDFAKSSSQDLKTQIQSFNNEKKQTFGYIHEASPNYLNFVANDFRELEDYKHALELYQYAFEKDPENIKVLVNICDVYDKMGDKVLAKPAFEKAIALLDDQQMNVSKSYYRDVKKWLMETLEKYKY